MSYDNSQTPVAYEVAKAIADASLEKDLIFNVLIAADLITSEQIESARKIVRSAKENKERKTNER